MQVVFKVVLFFMMGVSLLGFIAEHDKEYRKELLYLLIASIFSFVAYEAVLKVL